MKAYFKCLNSENSQRRLNAMLQRKKLDIDKLKRAYAE